MVLGCPNNKNHVCVVGVIPWQRFLATDPHGKTQTKKRVIIKEKAERLKE
jgi:hypothetical protein